MWKVRWVYGLETVAYMTVERVFEKLQRKSNNRVDRAKFLCDVFYIHSAHSLEHGHLSSTVKVCLKILTK